LALTWGPQSAAGHQGQPTPFCVPGFRGVRKKGSKGCRLLKQWGSKERKCDRQWLRDRTRTVVGTSTIGGVVRNWFRCVAQGGGVLRPARSRPSSERELLFPDRRLVVSRWSEAPWIDLQNPPRGVRKRGNCIPSSANSMPKNQKNHGLIRL